jgi:hypothetical protein
MWTKKRYLKKLFQEWGEEEMKDKDGGVGEFKYDIFDTLQELL